MSKKGNIKDRFLIRLDGCEAIKRLVNTKILYKNSCFSEYKITFEGFPKKTQRFFKNVEFNQVEGLKSPGQDMGLLKSHLEIGYHSDGNLFFKDTDADVGNFFPPISFPSVKEIDKPVWFLIIFGFTFDDLLPMDKKSHPEDNPPMVLKNFSRKTPMACQFFLSRADFKKKIRYGLIPEQNSIYKNFQEFPFHHEEENIGLHLLFYTVEKRGIYVYTPRKYMKITKHPQSAILIEDYKNKRILIDPGSYCYNENFTANDWGKIDVFLITHTHTDHCLPEAVKIIKQNNPDLIILSNSEVKDKLKNEADINSEIIKPEEERQINDIKITGIKSIHGDLPSGNPKPDVSGFLIDDQIYHPGDTIYFEQKPKAEIIFVPICGTVVMNPKEAAKFAKEINPKLTIPIHYDSPNYPVDVNDFVEEMEGYDVRVLKNGESFKTD